MIEHEVQRNIEKLLINTEISLQGFSIEAFKRVGNNRTYIVKSGFDKYFVKHFFQNRGDLRDRFGAELSFISYAEKVAPGFTPKILAAEKSEKIILYQFITGKPFIKGELIEEDIIQASNFFKLLNDPQKKKDAISLPNASETCFSVTDHIRLIGNRIKELETIPPDSDENKQALYIISRINTIWRKLETDIFESCLKYGIIPDQLIDTESRILSPSDFGFHNALKTDNGNIIFIDFEYAGWDDPSKMIGDFFGQIQIPVPFKYKDLFMDKCLYVLANQEYIKMRSYILSPAFLIKWACIALNIFLPVHLARRQFTNPDLDIKHLKSEQNKKALNIINNF